MYKKIKVKIFKLFIYKYIMIIKIKNVFFFVSKLKIISKNFIRKKIKELYFLHLKT